MLYLDIVTFANGFESKLVHLVGVMLMLSNLNLSIVP